MKSVKGCSRLDNKERWLVHQEIIPNGRIPRTIREYKPAIQRDVGISEHVDDSNCGWDIFFEIRTGDLPLKVEEQVLFYLILHCNNTINIFIVLN